MPERFFIIKQKNDRLMTETSIVVDLMTGVQYLWVNAGQAAGLTLMVDPDGRPLLYQGPGEFEEM